MPKEGIFKQHFFLFSFFLLSFFFAFEFLWELKNEPIFALENMFLKSCQETTGL